MKTSFKNSFVYCIDKLDIMKKLLLLLLLVPMVTFGQDDSTINLNVRKGRLIDAGITPLGSGMYQAQENGATYFVSSKTLEKRARKSIKLYAENQNANFKVLDVGKIMTPVYAVIVKFQLTNKDGSLIISKDEAKKELLSLKEFLEMGIITQEEFNNKAVSLKKILLGN